MMVIPAGRVEVRVRVRLYIYTCMHTNIHTAGLGDISQSVRDAEGALGEFLELEDSHGAVPHDGLALQQLLHTAGRCMIV
jgi:hypothetical protein